MLWNLIFSKIFSNGRQIYKIEKLEIIPLYDDLPDDILTDIFQFLPYEKVHRLKEVCRKFHTTVQRNIKRLPIFLMPCSIILKSSDQISLLRSKNAFDESAFWGVVYMKIDYVQGEKVDCAFSKLTVKFGEAKNDEVLKTFLYKYAGKIKARELDIKIKNPESCLEAMKLHEFFQLEGTIFNLEIDFKRSQPSIMINILQFLASLPLSKQINLSLIGIWDFYELFHALDMPRVEFTDAIIELIIGKGTNKERDVENRHKIDIIQELSDDFFRKLIKRFKSTPDDLAQAFKSIHISDAPYAKSRIWQISLLQLGVNMSRKRWDAKVPRSDAINFEPIQMRPFFDYIGDEICLNHDWCMKVEFTWKYSIGRYGEIHNGKWIIDVYKRSIC